MQHSHTFLSYEPLSSWFRSLLWLVQFGVSELIGSDYSPTRSSILSWLPWQDIDTFMKGMESGKRGHTFAKVDETLEKLLPAGARGVKQNK